RLSNESLQVKFNSFSIADMLSFSIDEIHNFFTDLNFSKDESAIALPIKEAILSRTSLLKKLGLSYLSLNRESTTLSGGEAQRIRLANQAGSGLRNILYVLDEPSIGLHAVEKKQMLTLLKQLRDNGNSVIVVEHDQDFMLAADTLIDVGPLAGKLGGEIIFSGKLNDVLSEKNNVQTSETLKYLKSENATFVSEISDSQKINNISLKGANLFNLKNISVDFKLRKFNVVTGVSGAGKSTLTHRLLGEWLKSSKLPDGVSNISSEEKIDKVIEIDQSPIGRTPRSNPATYTKLADRIRDLFAKLPETKEKGWKKGRFSFNMAGGRCEHCEGAGYIQVGMHFLGNVDVLCSHCHGKRFNEETLAILYKGKNIFEILEMQVDEALAFFKDVAGIKHILQTINDLGLGYIALGQKSTTLSGGEAQRIKLATELAKNTRGHVLYILDEPTTGLHPYDVEILLKSIKALVEKGNTVIAIEHDPDFILASDHIVDLGPGSGINGGKLMAMGSPAEVMQVENSLTGKSLRQKISAKNNTNYNYSDNSEKLTAPISFKNISTHNLKNIDVEIPVNKLTVITGVSGSGKSSLAFDTLFAEGQKRYIENFSAYIRSMISKNGEAEFEEVSGIMPTIAINQKQMARNPRSTVGTISELYDFYRLLFSRASVNDKRTAVPLPVSAFSFNNEEGACEHCKGLGSLVVCDPEKFVSDPEKPLTDGALNGSKTGKFYGDPYGQYIAALLEAGKLYNCDFAKSWNELSEAERQIAMYGTGGQEYSVTWKYKRKDRSGEHFFNTKWPGFTAHVNEEYQRKHADNRGDAMLPLMKSVECNRCNGSRLKPEIMKWKFAGYSIDEINRLSVKESIRFFTNVEKGEIIPANDLSSEENHGLLQIAKPVVAGIISKLKVIEKLGLCYLEPARSSSTLSGGESQRLRLAGMLNAGLTGVCYVLDEPTVG
ncbi:MAG: ATP-binding cassette domain-containing protein, partial [Bacteroidota bacterium]|nr:ATP-binding cassette domain-containing protein [Bacteroidota bacterium]